MAAKDGSFAFDYAGMYTALEDKKLIEYTLGEMKEYFIDAGRKVSIFFVDENCGTVKDYGDVWCRRSTFTRTPTTRPTIYLG
jgi:hypothetical protein